MDHSTSFSKSSLHTTSCFNLQGSILDPNVELSIPIVIESANSASSRESSQFD